MGKVGAPYTFNVNKMLELRVLGWSYSKLGRYFHKDHTTIIYHCNKWGIQPFQKPPPVPKIEYEEREEPEAPPKKVYKYLDLMEKQDGPINPGKSYKEYLKEALQRPIEKRYYQIYYENNDEPHDITLHLAIIAAIEEEERAKDNAESAVVVPEKPQGELRDRDKDDSDSFHI